MTVDRVVNVCFHVVGTPARELEPGEEPYWVSADLFSRILDEVATWPSVRISFDDSNASDAEIALPALAERGLTAQFYVLAGRFGQPGSLAPNDVRELAARGMTIGSHGMAHRPWTGLDQAAREAELVVARQQIEEAAGQPVTEAACPLGRYDRRLLADLRTLGYRRVYTSDRGQARPGSWLQPRFSVRQGDTPEGMRTTMLARPSLPAQAERAAKSLIKRLR